jgi:hypothetical protein
MHLDLLKRIYGTSRQHRRFINTVSAKRKDRRLVTKVLFDPTIEHGFGSLSSSSTYNMWDGFAADKMLPIDGYDEADALNHTTLEFIRQIMMNDNAAYHEFFVDWLASPVIQPAQRTRVGVIFCGPPNAGHLMFLEFYRTKVLGDNCTFHTDERVKFARWSQRVATQCSVVVQLDGVKGLTNNDIMKFLMRSNTFHFNHEHVPNFTNFVLTTPDADDIDLPDGDRSFVAYNVNDARVGDYAYFDTMKQHFENPRTARAFFQFLMTRDVAKYGYSFEKDRALSAFYAAVLPVPP